jgi:hypothetical protein
MVRAAQNPCVDHSDKRQIMEEATAPDFCYEIAARRTPLKGTRIPFDSSPRIYGTSEMSRSHSLGK